jgi:hypothetical protein
MFSHWRFLLFTSLPLHSDCLLLLSTAPLVGHIKPPSCSLEVPFPCSLQHCPSCSSHRWPLLLTSLPPLTRCLLQTKFLLSSQCCPLFHIAAPLIVASHPLPHRLFPWLHRCPSCRSHRCLLLFTALPLSAHIAAPLITVLCSHHVPPSAHIIVLLLTSCCSSHIVALAHSVPLTHIAAPLTSGCPLLFHRCSLLSHKVPLAHITFPSQHCPLVHIALCPSCSSLFFYTTSFLFHITVLSHHCSFHDTVLLFTSSPLVHYHVPLVSHRCSLSHLLSLSSLVLFSCFTSLLPFLLFLFHIAPEPISVAPFLFSSLPLSHHSFSMIAVLMTVLFSSCSLFAVLFIIRQSCSPLAHIAAPLHIAVSSSCSQHCFVHT